MATSTLLTILLVEDNGADADLVRECFRIEAVPHRLHVVTDGAAALSFLYRRPPYEDAPRPDLILLDLGLPRKDGRQVLAEVKGDPALRRIPITVLSSSAAESDIRGSYDLQANAYVTKPMEFEGYGKVVATIRDFWLEVVQLPAR